MRLAFAFLLLPGLLLLPIAGCAPSEADHSALEFTSSLSFRPLDTPARPGSTVPNLYADGDGDVLLSWVEPGDAARHALRFARLEGEAWSSPQTIAAGNDWFVNWADFPSMLAKDDGTLAAHFLAKSGVDTYAYDVHLTQSPDGGSTWSPALIPHRDGTQTEHGFVSMLPGHDGRLFAVWLDGRNTGDHDGHGGAMTLRTAMIDQSGAIHDDTELDGRVCDCCQTSAARTAHGLLVAYRDRSDAEIRDISVVRWTDGTWSEPRTLHADSWKLHGCPVNGPSVAADGERVAVAWFTAAQETPRVQVAFSDDEGATFGLPVPVDDGNPIGRIDTLLLPDGSALVSWVEKTGEAAAIRLRRVHPDGTREPSMTVAPTSPARASGFPRLARRADQVLLAWTEAGEPSLIHTAVATLNGSS